MTHVRERSLHIRSSRGHGISRAKGPIIERKQAAPITPTAFNTAKFSLPIKLFLLRDFVHETRWEDPKIVGR